MERFLYVNNKSFFDKQGIITLDIETPIPDKSCILFIGSHINSRDISKFIQGYLERIEKKPYTYILICGQTDAALNRNIKIPINVKYIYSMNINYVHPIIKFLPMGCDFRSISSFKKASIENDKRPILCYCNFSLNTHADRKIIYNILKPKKFITFEHMQNFLNYSISRDKFFERLGTSKFTVCPRGNALDTFRFYDTVYSGSIPIVVKESFHSLPIFQDIPVLFLDKITDFQNITSEYLEKKYIELSRKKSKFYRGFDFNSFIEDIQSMFIKENEVSAYLKANSEIKIQS